MDGIREPRLYRVTLTSIEGEREDHTALSFLGPQKAVAMAVEAHYGPDLRHLFRRTTWAIYDVEVEDVGPAPRTRSGLIGAGPRGTLEDRAEF